MQQSGSVLIDRRGTARHAHAATMPVASYDKKGIAEAIRTLDTGQRHETDTGYGNIRAWAHRPWPNVAGRPGDQRRPSGRPRRDLGGVLWSVGVTLAGYLLGTTIPGADQYLLPIVAVVVVVSLIPLALEVRRGRKRSSGGPDHRL
ncbi:hypothetical protein [Amycolatopsis sp. NPDC051061]|uniref:hypothetical protein n=1 Tax=Amycolatopsis sp. NPDC051061 TaxID=3155042 RepID=UPI00341978C7